MVEHKKAEAVGAVAREVMAEHHALLDQRGPRVEWVMTKPEKPGGSVPDWKIRRVTGIHAYLALDENEKPDDWGRENGNPVKSFIVVEVSEDYWQILAADQREAMCDHCLAHMQYDYDKGTWRIEGPEFGEFEEVLERRGFWRPDRRLRRFAEGMAEQLSLLGDAMGEDLGDYDGESEGREDLDVSITFGDRTVETSTGQMRRLSDGLADGSIKVGPNGEHVEAATGEVLEPAGVK